MSVIRTIKKAVSNLPGWKTSRKIVVIESDDWGSIRMPSNKARETLVSQNVNMGDEGRQRYTDFDTLASAQDLDALYASLSKFKDKNGRHPVITVVSVVANPDFEKIKASGYTEYFYEPFTVTLEKYSLTGAFDKWKEGIGRNLFIPQFHGREHLNVQVWLRKLRAGDQETLKAFEQGCWGYFNTNDLNIDYQAAFDVEFPEDIAYQEQVIKEGLQLFEKLHGYRADFFVPPNGPFNNALEKISAEEGIRFMSGSKMQLEPQGQGRYKKRMHWLGQKNKYGQRYITRNCFFEPSDSSKDWLSSCLNDMNSAFRLKKPAVISSHRVNYIGEMNPANRENSLRQLEALLEKALERWPDIEFMTSSELGMSIVNKS